MCCVICPSRLFMNVISSSNSYFTFIWTRSARLDRQAITSCCNKTSGVSRLLLRGRDGSIDIPILSLLTDWRREWFRGAIYCLVSRFTGDELCWFFHPGRNLLRRVNGGWGEEAPRQIPSSSKANRTGCSMKNIDVLDPLLLADSSSDHFKLKDALLM